MPLTLILGAAGSGKTEACYQGIREALAAPHGRRPLILLVPEQATHQTERAVLERIGPSWRLQVLSFMRLAFRAFQEAGGAARPPITELGRKMVLRSILQRRREELAYFGPLADRPGLLDHLSRTLRECRAYEMSPQDLLEAADAIGQGRPRLALPTKLRDLARIMTDLEAHLEGRYTDPDQTLTRLASRLPGTRLARGARVWVDGFSGFTPQEYGVLGALLEMAEHVHVTLCLQPDHRGVGSGLFQPTAETREKLISLALKAGHSVHEAAPETHASRARGGGRPAGSPGLGDLSMPGDLFSPTDLHGATDVPGHPEGVPWRFRQAPGIAHLEREFFAARPAILSDPVPDVTLIRASDPRAEIAAIAREILRLCREERYRYREMAVVVRDLESYHPLISAVFAEHGIPAFVDRRRSVAYHSLVELVRSAVETIAFDWPYEALFRFLKTDLAPVSRRDVDRLENLVLEFGLRGHARWTGPDWPGPEFMRQIRDRAVGPLARFHARTRGRRTVRHLCMALYSLLEDMGVPRKLERWAADAEEAGDLETASEHLQVHDAVLDLLDQLVEALGDSFATAEELLPILESGLAGLQLGLVPPSLDQVVVGSVERSRHPDLRAVFVCGAVDGAFPRPGEEDLVIDDAERMALASRGYDLGPTSRDRLLSEPFAMYLALTRASERLFVSYPQGDSEARGQTPSVLWTRVRELLPRCRLLEAGGEQAGGLEEVATVGQLAGWVASALRNRAIALSGGAGRDAGTIAGNGAGRDAEAMALSGGGPKNAGAIAGNETLPRPMAPGTIAVARGPDADLAALHSWLVADPARREVAGHALAALSHRNQAEPLPPDLARALYGTELHLSASRLEAMASCPFRQYAQYALALSDRPVYRVEPVEIGQFLHRALERFVRELRDQGVDLAALAPTERAARIGAAVVAALRDREGTALLSTGQSRHLVRKLERALESAAGALAEHARRGRFRPVGVEVAFGPEGPLPGITLEVAGGRRLSLRGQIDRVDAALGDDAVHFLLVIDYKRGSRDLSLEAVAHGLDLQMPLYLAVATRHGAILVGLQPDATGIPEPAGMLYFPVQPAFVTLDAPPTPEEIDARTQKAHKTRGLLHHGAAEAGFFDTPDGYSPIVPLRMRKDGSLVESQSRVAPADRLKDLLSHALERAAALGEAILDGRIDIAPFRLRDRSACERCSFRPVCRFDPQAGEVWRDLAPLDWDAAWKRIAASKGRTEREPGERSGGVPGGDQPGAVPDGVQPDGALPGRVQRGAVPPGDFLSDGPLPGGVPGGFLSGGPLPGGVPGDFQPGESQPDGVLPGDVPRDGVLKRGVSVVSEPEAGGAS